MKLAKSACLLLLVCLQGCFYPQPRQNTYTLSAARPARSLGNPQGAAISVSPLQIHPSYENQSFVYRLPNGQTQSDYYHRFLAAPEANITEQLKSWLQKSGHFRAVTGFNQSPSANYIVSGTIESLYGDFANPNAPSVVVAIRIYISPVDREMSDHRKFVGNYEKRVPLSGNSPDALVRAWDKALSQIFYEIERDINNAAR